MVQPREYLVTARKHKDKYFNIFFFPFMMSKIGEFYTHSSGDLGHETIQWHLPSGSCSPWKELSLVGVSDGTWRQRNSQLMEIENGRRIPHSWQRATEITGATSPETEPSTWGRMSTVLLLRHLNSLCKFPREKICNLFFFFVVYFSPSLFLCAVEVNSLLSSWVTRSKGSTYQNIFSKSKL